LVSNLLFIIACLIGGFVLRPLPAAAQIVALTNIEIRMMKTSTKPPLRITAETRNPNDFAVRDVEIECTIKDKAGTTLATYNSVVHGPLQPNQRTTTRNLNIGAWPQQGYAALCLSKRAQRVADPATASPAPASTPPPTTTEPTVVPSQGR
jgi:hypothetical protein